MATWGYLGATRATPYFRQLSFVSKQNDYFDQNFHPMLLSSSHPWPSRPRLGYDWGLFSLLDPETMYKTARNRLQRLACERRGLMREMANSTSATPRPARDASGVFRIQAHLTGQALLRRCHDDGWVDHDFDWITWSLTIEYNQLAYNRTRLKTATQEQLSHLLTVLVRQDRFVYGAWNSAAESGLLLGIVERAAALNG